MPWYMEANTTVQRQTEKYLMLHTNTNWFMGGNHPISMEYYYVTIVKILRELRWMIYFRRDMTKNY